MQITNPPIRSILCFQEWCERLIVSHMCKDKSPVSVPQWSQTSQNANDNNSNVDNSSIVNNDSTVVYLSFAPFLWSTAEEI
jgi:hypothetical protein